MFFKKLFGARPRMTIRSIQLASGLWQMRDQGAQQVSWTHPDYKDAALRSLHYFEMPPDLPCALQAKEQLQQYYLEMIARTGDGLLLAEPISIGNLNAFEVLVKTPAQPSGLLYIYSLTLPFNDRSFVIKIQAVERGLTGLREATVARQAMANGAPLTDNGIEGWHYYPYGQPHNATLPANRSEEAQYDVLFPQHPLSFVRRERAALIEGITYDPHLDTLAPFRP